MIEAALILLGSGQVGLLAAIFFRLGGLTATVKAQGRRIGTLEKERRYDVAAL